MKTTDFYKLVHQEAILFRRIKFNEVCNKENPEPYEELIIKEWARMFWRDFI